MSDSTPLYPPPPPHPSTNPNATQSLPDGVLGCRHQCSSGLRSNCSSLLDPPGIRHRLCVVHAYLCRWRAGNLCWDSTCWCSHVSPPNHISHFLLFPLYSRAKQEEILPHWGFSRLTDIGSVGYSDTNHSVALRNFHLTNLPLLPNCAFNFPHALKSSRTDSQAATLLNPPPPHWISPHVYESSQTAFSNPLRDHVLRMGAVLHRLGRCDWFLCCHCSLLAAAC